MQSTTTTEHVARFICEQQQKWQIYRKQNEDENSKAEEYEQLRTKHMQVVQPFHWLQIFGVRNQVYKICER